MKSSSIAKKCAICSKEMHTFKYVIRDDKQENDFQWWWRHIKGILTFKIWGRRKFATIIPICIICVSKIKLNIDEDYSSNMFKYCWRSNWKNY